MELGKQEVVQYSRSISKIKGTIFLHTNIVEVLSSIKYNLKVREGEGELRSIGDKRILCNIKLNQTSFSSTSGEQSSCHCIFIYQKKKKKNKRSAGIEPATARLGPLASPHLPSPTSSHLTPPSRERRLDTSLPLSQSSLQLKILSREAQLLLASFKDVQLFF